MSAWQMINPHLLPCHSHVNGCSMHAQLAVNRVLMRNQIVESMACANHRVHTHHFIHITCNRRKTKIGISLSTSSLSFWSFRQRKTISRPPLCPLPLRIRQHLIHGSRLRSHRKHTTPPIIHARRPRFVVQRALRIGIVAIRKSRWQRWYDTRPARSSTRHLSSRAESGVGFPRRQRALGSGDGGGRLLEHGKA